ILNELKQLQSDFKTQFPSLDIHVFQADFLQPEQVKKFADFCLEKLESIDMLVNNAGQFIPNDIADEPENMLSEMMQINLFAPYHLSRFLLPKMNTQNSAHIFFTCSVASLQAYPKGGSYSITKFALRGLTENLRFELKETNIKVTGIYPGATHSRSWANANIPETRIMESDDIAKMVLAAFHLSPSATVESIVLRPQKGDL